MRDIFSDELMLTVFVCTFVFVCALCFVLYRLFASEEARIQKRFEALTAGAGHDYQKEARRVLKDHPKEDPFFSQIGFVEHLRLLFLQAGMNSRVKPWCILSIGWGCLALVLVWMVTANPVYAVIGGVLCVLLRYGRVIQKRNKRVKRFEAHLAQSLDILSRSLRAGHPLPMGLQMVSKEMPDPISVEFAHVFHEQQMGLPIEESLKGMAQRVPLMDLRFFVLTVLIHRQTGGDLSEVLDNLSKVIRDRFKVLGQVRALTAEGRLSGWVLGVLPFFVFFIIQFINPEYTRVLFTHELGIRMVYTAVFFEVLGVIFIKKIVDIQV